MKTLLCAFIALIYCFVSSWLDGETLLTIPHYIVFLLIFVLVPDFLIIPLSLFMLVHMSHLVALKSHTDVPDLYLDLLHQFPSLFSYDTCIFDLRYYNFAFLVPLITGSFYLIQR